MNFYIDHTFSKKRETYNVRIINIVFNFLNKINIQNLETVRVTLNFFRKFNNFLKDFFKHIKILEICYDPMRFHPKRIKLIEKIARIKSPQAMKIIFLKKNFSSIL